ncbi:MAG: PLP-dependent aminotransferase family protein [Pseudomonadales bacterium]
MLSFLSKLSPDSEFSLQKQLRSQLTAAIVEGHVPCAQPLPSTRRLAEQLGVSRNTVIHTYQQLVDDGYLISRQRAGYYVNQEMVRDSLLHSVDDALTPQQPQWQRFLKRRPSEDKLNKLSNWQSYPYPFIYGQLDPALFPTNHWRECARDSVTVQSIKEWTGDRYDDDDTLLIEQIRSRILPRRGVWAESDEILITVGSQHGLYMLSQLLLDRDTTFGVEDPGYPDVIRIARHSDTCIRPLRVDGEGLVVDEQLAGCNLVFTTPSHQFPTTVTLPLHRRTALLERAREHDFLIVEDDYESETSFAAKPTPALKSLDRDQRVIYLGSLSKTLSPGLRLGYMVANRELIAELREFRRMMLRHPPMNNQRAVGLFLARGYHDALINNLVNIYRTRWHEVAQALQHHMPDAATPPAFGGSAYWVRGSERLDARELKLMAQELGVMIESGDIYFYGDNCPLNFFRIGYSSIATERIRPGIDRLAKVIARLQ